MDEMQVLKDLRNKGINTASSFHSDGHWINDRVSRIVEIIRDYDPNILIQWIPPEDRLPNDPAFCLKECHPGRPPYVMFYVQDEESFDESVLARIMGSDQNRNPLSLEYIDKLNAAKKLVRQKEQMDAMHDAHDLAQHIWRSPKSRYVHDGVVYE